MDVTLYTLASTELPRLAVDLMVLLATGAVVATVLRRFRFELIPGYLLAGAIIGPNALGLVSDAESIEQISELAVILLMFTIGMHLDLSSMRRGMVHILFVGIVSTLVFTAIGWGLTALLGLGAPQGLVIAMAMAMSSTAVLVRILIARRETRASHGRVTLGVAIVQDLAAVAVMAVLPPIAQWAGAPMQGLVAKVDDADVLPSWMDLLARAGVGLGGVVVMLAAGHVILPRVLHAVTKAGSSELMLVFSGAIALAAAIGTKLLGFSAEMGAFLAGFLLASTPYRYQLSGQLGPVRDILMAVFFTAVGLRVAPGPVIENWWIVALGVFAIIGLKFLIIAVPAWLAGMTPATALLSGAYLANAGEFSLVVLAAAGAVGILPESTQGVAIAIVILTLVISPFLIGPAHRLGDRMVKWPLSPWSRNSAICDRAATPAAGPPGEPPAHKRHIIVAGFGPVGRTLADRFTVQGIPFTVIELNPRTVQRQAGLGRDVVYGDVTNPDVLESAGIDEAEAVILTIPDDETTMRACRAIRALAPDVFIAARTSFLSGKFMALQLGADLVTVEEVATAQAMERDILTQLDVWRSDPSRYRVQRTPG